MSIEKVSPEDYIRFLLASPKEASCTEAAAGYQDRANDPAHDAFNRLLHRQPSDTKALQQEALTMVRADGGVLVLDDTTLDKPYAHHIELVTYHWSGKHQQVVRGINLITLLWTDGTQLIPCDFRVYDKPIGGHNKNEHFQEMLRTAKANGLSPAYVLFDGWYAGLENLKTIRDLQWKFLTRLKPNRQVDPDNTGNVALEQLEIGTAGRRVHLRGLGFIRVFRVTRSDQEIQYWATNEPTMSEPTRKRLAQWGWQIEVYHRGIKQCCNIERSRLRSFNGQWAHISCALRAFLRLEKERHHKKKSWYKIKSEVVSAAVRKFLNSNQLSWAYCTA